MREGAKIQRMKEHGDGTGGRGGVARAVCALTALAATALLATLPLQGAAPAAAVSPGGGTPPPDEAPPGERFVARLEGPLDGATAEALRGMGLEPVREHPRGLVECVSVEGFRTASSNGLPNLRWVEPGVTFRAAAAPPDDPDFPLQWNLADIGAEGAWERVGGGSGSVVVAVLDSGVAYRDSETGPRAPDLAFTRFVDGYDFYADDAFPDDENGHGTLVAEVLASSFNNGFRAAGIAYGCSVMPVRVLGPDAAGADVTVAQGIYWAVDNGADVICLALAATRHSEAVGEAVAYAYEHGVTCVAAAGNEGSDPGYPGGMDCPADEGEHVLAVGATDARGLRAHYSNYGEGLDLVAPGGDLTRDDNRDGYPDGVPQETFREPELPQGGFALTWNEGTSLAVPQVAAAAAMLLSCRGSLTPAQVARIITSTCRDLGEPGKDIYYGHGMLDIPAALDAAVSSGWYFAEGTTQEGFEEWFCVANPNAEAAAVEFTFFQEDGSSSTHGYAVPPRTRFTLSANAVAGEGLTFSARVDADLEVVAERSMYFAYLGEWAGGSAVMGSRTPSDRWYFAEGYTARGSFETFLCLLNPWLDPVEVTVDYMVNGGSSSSGNLSKTYVVPGTARLTLSANQEAGYDAEISTVVRSERPIVAERPMYFDYRQKWRGGHGVMGATAPAAEWYFAEGTTREGFETWLCLANPGDEPAEVTVDYIMGQGQGAAVSRKHTVPGASRSTVDVNLEAGPGRDVSLRVTSDRPIVAERPMYFEYGEKWNGGHDVMGATAPAGEWYFAEGTTREGFETWLCLANPGESQAVVTVTFLPGEGQGNSLTRPYTVPAGTRRTVKLNDVVGADKDVSMRLSSTRPIVAERPMYFCFRGAWDGGHVVMGDAGG